MLLSDAIGHYKADRVSKGYARNTVRAEQYTLREFLAAAGNIQVSSIGPRQVDALFFKKQDWAAGTANKAKAHLQSFFKWSQARGYMPRTADPLEGIRNRRATPRDRVVIPPTEFTTVLEAADNPRDRAIVAIGLYLFVRVSEIRMLKWQNVDFDEARKGTERWTPTVTVYRPKTQTEDVLPMSEELYHELRRWRLAYSAEIGQVPVPTFYLIPRRTPFRFTGIPGQSGGLVPMGQQLLIPNKDVKDLTKVIRKVLENSGYLGIWEGGHTLRRSGAIAWYNQLSSVGHDRAIRMCQAMLGHASIRTTEVYLRLDLDRKTRNDLLAGKRMFPPVPGDGVVVNLEDRTHEEDSRAVRL